MLIRRGASFRLRLPVTSPVIASLLGRQKRWFSCGSAAVYADADDEPVNSEAKPAKKPRSPPGKMVPDDSPMQENLKTSGYQLIGSHSAVKMCRWTKNSLKRRGQCYKHTFYGISSHQCMEMTPSLACANKCVFCWRNYSNPVTKKWKYETDDPEFLLDSALEAHKTKFVKQVLSGKPPTLDEERASDALANVKHCAMSLVGEPVLYPKMPELLDGMYKRGISTFIVTNGQFPEDLERAGEKHVTQLYCSVDAGNEAELRRIGRPLFADAWDRLMRSLDILREKKCRTVCRLTYVKNLGMPKSKTSPPPVDGDERADSDSDGAATTTAAFDAATPPSPEFTEADRLEALKESAREYATVLRRAMPDFIEVKGVTFAPQTFQKNGLTISDNIPTHTDVLQWGAILCAELWQDGYAVASEHHHSCSVLIARRDRWFVEGTGESPDLGLGNSAAGKQKQQPSGSDITTLTLAAERARGGYWKTWIDFERLSDGSEGKVEKGVRLPSWAVYGAPERGLDPHDTPRRSGRRPDDVTKDPGESEAGSDGQSQSNSEEQRQSA